MIKGGAIRKVVVPGRAGVGEVLILVRDLGSMIHENALLEQDVKERFVKLLHDNPTALGIPRDWVSASDAKDLMHAGFLTSATPSWTSSATQNTDGRKGPSGAGTAGPADFSQTLHGLESPASSTPAPLDPSSATKI